MRSDWGPDEKIMYQRLVQTAQNLPPYLLENICGFAEHFEANQIRIMEEEEKIRASMKRKEQNEQVSNPCKGKGHIIQFRARASR